MLPGNTFAGKYRLIKKVGIRAYAEIWQALDESVQDKIVALKIYSPERGMDDFSLKLFYKEFAELLRLSHPNLLRVAHFDLWQSFPFLLMPYCSGGSLYQKNIEDGPYSEYEIAKVLSEIGGALAYLHDQGVLHRNIKPDNILIDHAGNYLLSEYGISSQLNSILRKNSGGDKILSLAYAPPELFGSRQISSREGDVFAMGILIYELCTKELPWMGTGGSILREDSILPELPDGYSLDLQQLLQHCLQYTPAARPSAANISAAGKYYLQHGRWPTPYHSGNSSGQNTTQARPLTLHPLSDEHPEFVSREETTQEKPIVKNEKTLIPSDKSPEPIIENAELPVIPIQNEILQIEEEVFLEEASELYNEEPIPPTEQEEAQKRYDDLSEEEETLTLDTHQEVIENIPAAETNSDIVISPIDTEITPNIDGIKEESDIVEVGEAHTASTDAINSGKVKDIEKDIKSYTEYNEDDKRNLKESEKSRNRMLLPVLIILILIIPVIMIIWYSTRQVLPPPVNAENKEYISKIKEGNAAMLAGYYLKARSIFQMASLICLTDCEEAKTGEVAAADSISAGYARFMSRAEILFKERKYKQAWTMFSAAAILNPGDSLSSIRLEEIKMIMETPVKVIVATERINRTRITLKDEEGNNYYYSGQLTNEIPEGEGEAIYADGSGYKGQFKYGRRSGQGTISWSDGTTYTGQFLNNRFHGIGILSFPNGDRYEGEFRHGEKTSNSRFISGQLSHQ